MLNFSNRGASATPKASASSGPYSFKKKASAHAGFIVRAGFEPVARRGGVGSGDEAVREAEKLTILCRTDLPLFRLVDEEAAVGSWSVGLHRQFLVDRKRTR